MGKFTRLMILSFAVFIYHEDVDGGGGKLCLYTAGKCALDYFYYYVYSALKCRQSWSFFFSIFLYPLVATKAFGRDSTRVAFSLPLQITATYP